MTEERSVEERLTIIEKGMKDASDALGEAFDLASAKHATVSREVRDEVAARVGGDKRLGTRMDRAAEHLRDA